MFIVAANAVKEALLRLACHQSALLPLYQHRPLTLVSVVLPLDDVCEVVVESSWIGAIVDVSGVGTRPLLDSELDTWKAGGRGWGWCR